MVQTRSQGGKRKKVDSSAAKKSNNKRLKQPPPAAAKKPAAPHPRTKNERVRVNVGGQIHEFSRDILQRYPDSMLACMTAERWTSQRKEDIPFIDRNGQRFGYVLDLYRDGVVHLPVTVAPAALKMDLEYFGIELDDDEDEIKTSSVVEATAVSAALDEDMEAQLKAFDETIEEKKNEIKTLEQKRAGIQIADAIFRRFRQSQDRQTQTPVTVTYEKGAFGSVSFDLQEMAREACNQEAFLKERLETVYGIKLMKAENPNYETTVFVVRDASSTTARSSTGKSRRRKHN